MTTTESPSQPEQPDAPLVVAAFLARYFADQAASTLRSREDYEALFPGYAAVVRAEFDRLQSGDASQDEVEGERLAGYRIVRELGRGGQGIVYLAEDERLARQVALKVLPGAFSATVARQRLLREAQAASRLDDPGICTVYDAGEQDGVAFIAMRYVEGDSLQARIDAERKDQTARLADPLRIQELLQTFEAVLRSLHRAHEKGLVHRDIKPSNLMLRDDGTPMILDFGLASFDDHPDGSLTGEVALGTPAYMSPEQLTAREGRVDARSDVFSLAVTLYESLTLQHPFEAPTRERLYQHILQDEAPPLRKLCPGLPRDLDVVLQCALSKDRTRRYATALAFADDLAAVRLRQPIGARKVSRVERVVRWAQRNPMVASLLLLLGVASVAFVAITATQNRGLVLALGNEKLAQTQAQRALVDERVARERSQALYLVGLSAAQRAQDPELSLLLAREARQRLDHHLTRSTLRDALEHVRVRPVLAGVVGAKWVRVSPTGERVAIGTLREVRLFDVATRQTVATLSCANAGSAGLWWSDDGVHLLIAPGNNLVRFEGGNVVDADCELQLHDGRSGELLTRLRGARGQIAAVHFKGNWLLAGDAAPKNAELRDGTVSIWSLPTAELAFQLDGSAQGVAGARFVGGERADSFPDFEVLSRDGVYRRMQGRAGKVLHRCRVVPEAAGRPPRVFLGKMGQVYVQDRDQIVLHDARGDDQPLARPLLGGLCQYPVGGPLLEVSRDAPRISPIAPADLLPLAKLRGLRRYLGGLKQLAMPPRELVHVTTGRRQAVRTQLFPNIETTVYEPTVVGVFVDGSIRVWPLGSGGFFDAPPIGGGVVAAHTSKHGDVAAVVNAEGRVRVFATLGGSLLPEWRGAQANCSEALHRDGHRVLSYRSDGATHDEAVCVDLRDGSEAWAVEPSSATGHVQAAWSPDGATCVVAAADGELQLVRTRDGEVLHRIAADGSDVHALEFDPTGRYFAVQRQSVELWRVAGPERVHVFEDVPMVASFRFAADGERLVLAHTTSHQVRSIPAGELVSATPEQPWHVGVPCSVAGPFVLLTRLHQCRGSRVGGFGESWVLDTRDGSRVAVPGQSLGRGGLSPDGERVVVPLPDGALEVSARASGKRLHTLRGHDRPVNCVRFAASGEVFVTGWASQGMASGQDERALCVWSHAGDLLQKLEFRGVGISWFDLSLDGDWVVYKTNDEQLRRFPVHPMKLAESLKLRDLTDAERDRFEVR